MRLSHWLSLVGLSLSITGSAYAWDYTVSYSGNTVIVNVSGMDNSKTQETCAGASMDDPSGGGAHCGIPGLSFDTVSVTCNRLGAHVLYVEVFDSTTGGTYEVRQTAVNISTPPPPSCPQYLFGAKGSTVLTHKYGPEDYNAISDFREVYWDAAATSAIDGKKGAYVSMNKGRRYAGGELDGSFTIPAKPN